MARRIVGQATARVDGPAKVTGQSQYSADVDLPGMLRGKVLRSPYPHARIISIDTSAAEALPGVHAVITGQDKAYLIGRAINDLPVLASDEVRFIGDRVAAVAAENTDIAEAALGLIEVEYEELPAVFSIDEAVADDAYPVHQNPKDYEGAFNHPGEPKVSNVCAYFKWDHGDIDAAMAGADQIFEHEFETPFEHHGYLEPNVTVADVQSDGGCQMWSSNKSPYMLRLQLAKTFELPPETFEIHMTAIGGDFGGKGNPFDAPVAYLLSKAAGRPVKLVMTYTEELMAANGRHASKIKLRTGVTNDGKLCGIHLDGWFNTGAYGAFKPLPTLNLHGVDQAGSCYRIPAIDLNSTIVYSNTLPAGHMRAPGGPQVMFAVEAQFDLIAKALNMDPAEFRLANVLLPGDTAPAGQKWVTVRARETLQAALDGIGWQQRDQEPGVGYGIGMYERGTIGGDCSARLIVNSAAQITVEVPIPDPGQGTYTAVQQMVAEAIDGSLDQITIKPVSTKNLPFDFGVGGSRTTFTMGLTTIAALDKLKAQIAEPVGGGEWQGGTLTVAGKQHSFSELVAQACATSGNDLVVDEYSKLPLMPELADTNFTAQAVKVRVDMETGQVAVEKIVSAHDVGTIINPVAHLGQLEGGVIYALGMALMSEYRFDEGKPEALHLGDYKLPNIKDIPPLETILLERDEGPGPFNLGPVGEASNVALPGAIANAVADAIGKPAFQLPLTAERVYGLING